MSDRNFNRQNFAGVVPGPLRINGGSGLGIVPGPLTLDGNKGKGAIQVPLKKTRHVDRKARQEKRLSENKKYLENKNILAFLTAIAEAEHGDYNLKYGGVKGKKHDKWRFSDFSTHPGPGADGVTTAAGRYQINKATWRDFGITAMGLKDFSPLTQDLIAVERLRSVKAIDAIIEGDIDFALSKASGPWAALPKGRGKPNRYPKQPYMKYDDFVDIYKSEGGTIK